MFKEKRPLAESDLISKAEDIMGLRFPPTYKHYLQSHNGGAPIKEIVEIRGKKFFAQIFWPLIDSIEQRGILERWKSHEELCRENRLIPLLYAPPNGEVFVNAVSEELYALSTDGEDDVLIPLLVTLDIFLKKFETNEVPRDVTNEIDYLSQAVSWSAIRNYLDRGGDINARGTLGMTLAEYFLSKRNFEIFRALLEFGPDLSGSLHSVMSLAPGRDVIKVLREAGVDLNERDAQGRRVIEKFPEWRRHLIEFGANP